VTDAAELLAAIDTTANELERARQAVRIALEARAAAFTRHREAVNAFDAWSKQALT